MQYNPPVGATSPNASYVGKNIAAGQQGSRVPRMAVEGPQREIVNVITGADMVPSNSDLSQLLKAILKLIRDQAPLDAMVHRGVNTGSVNALRAVITPGATAYATGALYIIDLTGPNTAAATCELFSGTTSLGAKDVKRSNGSALRPGDMSRIAALTYDGNDLVLLNLAQETAPPGSGFGGRVRRFGYAPETNVASVRSAAFTTAYAGVILATSSLNSSPSNGNIDNAVSIQVGGSQVAGGADTVPGASTSIAVTSVPAGASVTVVSTITPTEPSPYNVSQTLNYLFIPA